MLTKCVILLNPNNKVTGFKFVIFSNYLQKFYCSVDVSSQPLMF